MCGPLPAGKIRGLAGVSQSRSQDVHHFCDGVTTLRSTIGRPVDCAYFHERRHGSYRDMVDQSCDGRHKSDARIGSETVPPPTLKTRFPEGNFKVAFAITHFALRLLPAQWGFWPTQ